MRTLTVNVYTILELSTEVQKDVISKNRQLEVDDTNWYRFVLEEFAFLCAMMGIDTNPEKIWFSGFYHQGSGSAFDADINILQLLNTIAKQSWKEQFPKLSLDFMPCIVQQRILKQIEKGNIHCHFYTLHSGRYYNLSVQERHHYKCTGGGRNLDIQMEILSDWVSHVLNILNRHLYRTLENSYNALTSDTAVIEYLVANEWQFTQDGKNVNYLT